MILTPLEDIRKYNIAAWQENYNAETVEQLKEVNKTMINQMSMVLDYIEWLGLSRIK